MSLQPDEIEELKESFRYNDRNADGRIGFAEFLEMLEQLEAGIEEEEARIGFDEVDTDDDGSIDFEEFAAWWEEQSEA